MKHFGDITKIHGDQVPIVDIITGGSPCQDLSVAGKRAGLAGERSGLFIEQLRVVKEMRNECRRRLSVSGTDYDIRCIRPRFMVWENVCGAFTSGNPRGADFKAVLEEICKVVVEDVPGLSIPDGGWSHAGCIEGVGDSKQPFSIAWRTHDAQFWGVPQRRRRIALVADFGGLSASQILFERKSVSGDIEESGKAGQTASEALRGSIDPTGSGRFESVIAFDRAAFNQGENAKYDFSIQEGTAQPIVSRGPGGGNDVIGSLCARDYKGVGNQYVEEGKCIIQFYAG